MRRLTDEELGVFEASLIAVQNLPAPNPEQIVTQLTSEQIVVAEKYSRFVEEERRL